MKGGVNMANKMEQRLNEEQLRALSSLPLVFLITHDSSKQWPITHAISWVHAADDRTVRFAIEEESLLVSTLKSHPIFTLIFFAAKSAYSLTCTDVNRYEPKNDLPLALALFEGHVEEVRDILFYGAEIKESPEVVKAYDEEAAKRLDEQVHEALRRI